LATLAKRKFRYVLVEKLSSKHSRGVTTTINSLLGPHKHNCHTVTFDNDKEFAKHEAIASELKADIDFAHPYHSWERGLNENTNGLLRQYFSKVMGLTTATQEQVEWATDRLNHRPKKVLGFRSPHEVFFGVKKRYTKTSLAIALRT